MPTLPQIPEFITVHLGRPDEEALNVTVPFPEYIMNVASSEIYPTWPENALRANIYAQISFALNRIYTGYYRIRGYDFDITNSTAFDQYFVNGREIFENIRQIVGDIFNSYLRRQGNVEPLFAQYCNGTTVTCEGLSQWGTVDLANQGLTPYQILTNYYGNDIDIVTDVPITGNVQIAPRNNLRLGMSGDEVRALQIRLNRISTNYPAIPKIVSTNGIFSYDTEDAVIAFQNVFGLEPDGIVGKATWYAVQYIYNSVARLNELDSEGIDYDQVADEFPSVLRIGDSGENVKYFQFILNYLSAFYNTIPSIAINGVFNEETESAVKAAQATFGLTSDGIVEADTWNAIYNAYLGIVKTVPLEFVEGNTVPYQGVVLTVGSDSEEVVLLQQYLNYISNTYPEIPQIPITGYYGTRTRESVVAFQRRFGIPVTGNVNGITWDAITREYSTLYNGSLMSEGQYSGHILGGE